MRRLQNLHKVNRFLEEMNLRQTGAGFRMVTSQASATTRLDKSSGDQVVIARPECRISSSDQDSCRTYIDTVIFVLTKDLGAGRTDAKESEAYGRLAGIASAVIEHILESTTSGCCELMSGLVVTSINVVPEEQIFGSWFGWSIELSLES